LRCPARIHPSSSLCFPGHHSLSSVFSLRQTPFHVVLRYSWISHHFFSVIPFFLHEHWTSLLFSASGNAIDPMESSWRVKSGRARLLSQHVTDQMAEDRLCKSHLMSALDVCTLYPTVAALGFSSHDMRALFQLTEFTTLQFRSRQICFLHEYAINILHQSLEKKELSEIFEMCERTIQRALAKGPQDPNPPGAPSSRRRSY
jgi:hypothetical protein